MPLTEQLHVISIAFPIASCSLLALISKQNCESFHCCLVNFNVIYFSEAHNILLFMMH